MIQFQPYEVRSTLADASSSSPIIASLLQQQGANLGEVVKSLGEVGKSNRTSSVNDLIARGGLEGLNEQQARQALMKASGGTLTTEGQAQIDKVLGTIANQDTRKFTTSERESGQDFTKTQSVDERAFKDEQSSKERASKLEESEKERKAKSSELEKDRATRTSEGEKDRALRISMQDDSQNSQAYLQDALFDRNVALKNLETANALKLANENKTTTANSMIEKTATEQLLSNPKVIEEKTNVIQQLLDKDNMIFNAKLDDQSKAVVGKLLYDGFDSNEGRKAIASGNPDAIKSFIDSELKKKNLRLDEGLLGGVSLKGM